MEITYLIGYVFATLTGVILGVLGGGGSMIILPIFVYLFSIEPSLAVLYSLFVVGFSSLIGASAHFRLGNVNLKIALTFGVPSVLSVLSTRKFILPILPDKIIEFSWFTLDKNTFLMSFFAFMMLFASYFMFTDKNQSVALKKEHKSNLWALAFEGVIVGLVTGLVGAGGGFLIIPALIYFAKLPIKIAIGTSLTIIAFNSLIGFSGTAMDYDIDWKFLSIFSAITSVGILIGTNLSKKINADKLKIYFAIFILTLGSFIIVKEFAF